MGSRKAISVVVPTSGRPSSLRRCLAALERQSITVEVVVSEDPAGNGPAAARNAGASRAAGDIVLFTDDDCIPDPDWAVRLSAACPNGGAAAGETVTAVEGNAFAATSQLLTSGLQRASLRTDGTLGFAPTSNLAVSRELLARVPFDASFPAAAGEDREWCARAAALGAPLRFEPAAVVRHHQDLGFGGFCRQQCRYGRGAGRYRRAGGRLADPRTRRKLIGAAFRAGPANGLLAVLAQLAIATGYLAERAGAQR
jgi:GT2 family glycosyltransferase